MAILPLQLARVSNLLRSNVANQTIARTQSSLLDVQNQLSTGKRINVPSDDPGDSAIVQQLRKTLERRDAYTDNLKQATSQLGEVDSSLSDMSGLLLQAQTIASANVGSDVTAEQRQSAAAVVKSLYGQMLTLANKQLEGMYLFAGDKADQPPFVEAGGGVKFVGSEQVLQNVYDDNSVLPFMVDGAEVFGALSSRVAGNVDLSPRLTTTTRLSDLKGANGKGVQLGPITIGNGSTTAVVDLTHADTIGDVINAINGAGVGGVTAGIGAGGTRLEIIGTPAETLTVNDISGGTTASDLGILHPTGTGAGVAITGQNIPALVTPLTKLADLRSGAGIDTAHNLVITNGAATINVNISACVTVEDLLNAINGSNANVRAEINAAGNGVNIFNATQGTLMSIGESGGTTAADLGVRSYGPSTQLSELNLGKGVRTVSGADIQIGTADGNSFQVDLSSATTIQDVMNAISAASGGSVSAVFSSTTNGIVLTDGTAGGSPFTISPVNFSNAAADLGFTNAAVGNTLTSSDVNMVKATGVFSNLAKLRDALLSSDQTAITESAEGLKEDYDRVTRIRGETGARVQELESRQNRLDEQNLATKSLLSSLEDTDFTEAISRFQTLQTALQASLQTSGRMLNLSLLDFLG
ncbi:MAG: flagellar hook-associated protein FlgL [Phycisphaerales bacterium]|jgi:flagellin-like hook-associated protein FlgL|nr:flagellar hook-associated protein FlgL [Phycisphaerales bacterium]